MVPKPVKSTKLNEDKRKEYLEGWKKLFEEIDPSIKAHLYFEENFAGVLKSTEIRYVDFRHSVEPVLIVWFDKKEIVLGSHQYLCGKELNEMFSDMDVERDMFQNPDLDCDPEMDTWENWYNQVCSSVDAYRKRIPKPPKKAQN